MKEPVEAALKVLVRQMLVQKNGSVYIFLTDEEQEINNEIEKENIEMPEVITKISEMIFEDILSEKKYRYPAFGGRYTFSFNQIVDDRPYKANQSYDVGLRILTPWYEGGTDDATLRMMSGQGKEVLVLLPNDDEFLREMQAYMKIESFLRKKCENFPRHRRFCLIRQSFKSHSYFCAENFYFHICLHFPQRNPSLGRRIKYLPLPDIIRSVVRHLYHPHTIR